MPAHTAHLDTFARDNLPPRALWPDFRFDLPELQYPDRLNCATELLDRAIERGLGDKVAFYTPNERWTYRQLLERANRIARVLSDDFGLVPGNRVLLRAANNPMLVACWFAVLKAGGIAVTTMPLLRARELAVILEKARVTLALCDERLADELEQARARAQVCRQVCYFNGSGQPGASAELEERMRRHAPDFENVDTSKDDVALIAFTSGTTGKPKGTMHFHRDVMAICDCFPRSILRPVADDVFIGSPPMGFTFGLGGVVTFPMRFGASAVLLEAAPPDVLLQAIQQFRPSICFTSPTAYRMMLDKAGELDLSSLEKCVSAGEPLPLPTFEAWQAAHRSAHHRRHRRHRDAAHLHLRLWRCHPAGRDRSTDPGLPGNGGRRRDASAAARRDRPPRRARPDRLSLSGRRAPEGICAEGWNLTGDAYKVDRDGYFWFQARTDDMIISAGYNVAGPEVEEALLEHDAVAECAVVSAPDPVRGQIVKAFIVPRQGIAGSDALRKELQEFVKQRIAAYKYPRAIEFLDALPRTETGKVQRFRLRQIEAERAAAPAA